MFIMSWVKTIGVLFAASAMVGVPLGTSVAQDMGVTGAWVSGYIGAHPVGSQFCPGLAWHIRPVKLANQSFNLSGPIWFEDGSGMSFATGTRQADGTFSLNVESRSGNGPTATITGQRMPDGSADVTLAGASCLKGRII
jgi:hypothetical protein